MKSAIIGVLVLLSLAVCVGQPKAQPALAEVTIVAVMAGGNFLEEFEIRSFRDAAGRERASSFVKGRATGIPMGIYRLKVEADAFEDAEVDVDVNSARTLIKLGLDWPGLELNERTRFQFRGTLKGPGLVKSGPGLPGVPAAQNSCRASGLYLRRQYDAPLDPATGKFDFGPVRAGAYIVTCMVGNSPMVLGSVNVNASSGDFSFEMPGELPAKEK